MTAGDRSAPDAGARAATDTPGEVELPPLRDDQRRAIAARLDEQRERAVARIAALERDHAEIVERSADAVRDDEHDPEGATIAFEREQVAALLADARASAAATEEALARLDDADFGGCERCGGAIGVERLLARPTATRCAACAD